MINKFVSAFLAILFSFILFVSPSFAANCADVGSSGNEGVQVSIPEEVIVSLSGYAQSAAPQTAWVQDSKDKKVATITYTGSDNPGLMNMAHFTSDGQGYKVYFSNDGSSHQVSRVLGNESSLVTPDEYAKSWTFVTEDDPSGNGCDFNDSTIYLTWNLNSK